eukprot:656314-Rhodomonas_salina.1
MSALCSSRERSEKSSTFLFANASFVRCTMDCDARFHAAEDMACSDSAHSQSVLSEDMPSNEKDRYGPGRTCQENCKQLINLHA